jgi:dTDP-4-amino-4,6-dideoxygalactose transaminase
MFLALKVLGLGEGDEVITSPNTFTSTVNIIHHTGAAPVLADIEEVTFGLDPEKTEAAITDKTRAILAVHYGGQPCYIERLRELAETRGLFLVEDVAHGFGAELDGAHLGRFGDFGAFSFYATKNLSMGEGGFLACRTEDLEKEAALMGFHGMGRDAWKRYTDRGSWYYEVERFGYKFNMSDVQASLGLVQLHRADELLQKRTLIAEKYQKALVDEEALLLPPTREGALHSWHLFVLRLRPGALRIDRDHFLKALSAEGIIPSLHFIPIHHHPAHRQYFGDIRSRLPASEEFYQNCFSLPLFPTMEQEETGHVVEAVLKLLRYYRS